MRYKTLLAAFLTLLATQPAGAAIDVVATTPELAWIARTVGGARVSVQSLTRPDQDYHRMEARPTDVRRVADADLLVRVGMDLDMWADALINAAGNARVRPGGAGYVDASESIRKLDVPTGKVTGASGDIHVEGNPHYWLDPGNAKVVAYSILLGLRRVDPRGAQTYDANYSAFAAAITKRMSGWLAEMKPFQGKQVVAYHAEWVYFLNRFGLKPFGYLEPKPGVPPSASHVNYLVQRMKASRVRAVVVPSIYPDRYSGLLQREANAVVVRTPYSIGSMKTTDYFNYMDAIVGAFKRALGG